jgi:hypothetical protein
MLRLYIAPRRSMLRLYIAPRRSMLRLYIAPPAPDNWLTDN